MTLNSHPKLGYDLVVVDVEGAASRRDGQELVYDELASDLSIYYAQAQMRVWLLHRWLELNEQVARCSAMHAPGLRTMAKRLILAPRAVTTAFSQLVELESLAVDQRSLITSTLEERPRPTTTLVEDAIRKDLDRLDQDFDTSRHAKLIRFFEVRLLSRGQGVAAVIGALLGGAVVFVGC